MITKLRGISRRIVTGLAPSRIFGDHYFSQQGEDMIVNCLLRGQSSGFYVDIGAHHPLKYSNTAYFFYKGWRGINIDPNVQTIRAYKTARPNDLNLNLGVANQEGCLKYYMFSESAVNTFSEADAKDHISNDRFGFVGTTDIPVLPLSIILENNLPSGQEIDVMSVDVEGLDEMVLRSNNWSKYRPRLLLVEDLNCFTLHEAMQSPLTAFLDTVSYVPIAKCVHTLVFADKDKAHGRHDVLIG